MSNELIEETVAEVVVPLEGNFRAALLEALYVVEQYQLDICGAHDTFDELPDLAALGLCQGEFYQRVAPRVSRALKKAQQGPDKLQTGAGPLAETEQRTET